ncbi:hypothetical protein MRX96_058310 [Rhipicephalus microplus]
MPRKQPCRRPPKRAAPCACSPSNGARARAGLRGARAGPARPARPAGIMRPMTGRRSGRHDAAPKGGCPVSPVDNTQNVRGPPWRSNFVSLTRMNA